MYGGQQKEKGLVGDSLPTVLWEGLACMGDTRYLCGGLLNLCADYVPLNTKLQPNRILIF